MFSTVVLQKTLESPLDSKEIKPDNPKGNQPWILIGRTDAEAPILWRPDIWPPANSLEKTLMLEHTLDKTEGKRRRGRQRMRWLDDTTDSMEMNLGELRETVRGREAWCAADHGVTKSRTWFSNWTTKQKKKNLALYKNNMVSEYQYCVCNTVCV